MLARNHGNGLGEDELVREREYAAYIRYRDVRTYPVSALAFYLFYR